MYVKVSAKPFAGMVMFAALAYPQSATKAPDEKPTAVQDQAAKQDQATREAQRQGRVAMTPEAQSPPETMQQAIAFERYKELAAEREARREGSNAEAARSADRSADRSMETPARPVKAKKPARQQSPKQQ